ncbi:MAG: hypothetical protein IJD91_02310 [Clostridia bacterium]|nr:hypothetical protein [Clostridia bacterium]
MKKIAIVFTLIILCMASNAYAKEVATIPSFDVHFNGNKVESEYREYPLLVYKDITYFPMTYFDSRHLGIETQWDEESNTLTISRTNINSILTAYKSESKNSAKNDVTICDFNIIVNGTKIDNKAEPYPLLTFRDVTYFPLTWRFAVDMFHWEYSFDSESGLTINSANHKIKMLDLSSLEMVGAYAGFTCDGEYYYHHNSANGNIYRTPVDDLDNQEIICNIGSGIPAGLGFSDGKVFLNYHSGGATMGTTYQYYINKDKTLTEANPPRSTMLGAVSYYRAYGDGVTAELSFFTGTWEFCYYSGENKTEVEIPGISFGTPGRHSSNEVIPPQIVGDNIYVIGYKGEEETKILYSINVENGEISEIASNVDNFVAYDTFVSRKNNSRIKIIYSAEGKLYQYLTETKELFEIDNDSKPLVMMVPMIRKDISTTVTNPYTGMYVVTGDDEGYSVFMFDDYRGIDPSPRQGTLIMEFSPKTSFSYQNGYLIARDKSENPKARLVVFDPWNGFYVMSPFKSADDATAITIFGNTLIYRNIETGEFCVVELKI